MRQWWDAFMGGGGAYAIIRWARWLWDVITDDGDEEDEEEE